MDYGEFSHSGKIVALGDMHVGSECFDSKKFFNCLERIKHNKAKIILMGDLFENASRDSVGSGIYDQYENPTDQVDHVIKWLTPFKKDILFYHRGNHEERSYRFCGTDVGKLVAQALEVPYYKNMALTKHTVGKNVYTLFSWHGSASSQTTSGRIRNLQKQTDIFDADAYLMGHTHELYAQTTPVRRIIGKEFRDDFKHLVLTGSFLHWDDSYAEAKGWRMVKKGAPLIKLNPKEFRVDVSLEW